MGGFNAGQTFGNIPGQPGTITQPQVVKQQTQTEETKTVKNVTENITKTTATIDAASLKAVENAKKQIGKDTIKIKVDNKSANKSIKDTTKLITNLTKKAKTVKVEAKGAPEVKKLAEAINKVKKRTVKVTANVGSSTKNVNNLANALDRLESKNLTVSATVHATLDSGSDTLTLSVTGKKSAKLSLAAMGRNNVLPSTYLPGFGSMARGVQGKLGPRGKGGKTLVGELGPELAWLPNQDSSVLLGADGPEVVDLPKDAVVYTADQTKQILKKQNAKKFGSASKGTTVKNNAKVTKYSKGEDINAYFEIQVSAKQSEYNVSSANSRTQLKDLVKLLREQLALLKKQRDGAKKMYDSTKTNFDKLNKNAEDSNKLTIKQTKINKKGKATTEDKEIDTAKFTTTDASGAYIVDEAALKKYGASRWDAIYKQARNSGKSDKEAKKIADKEAAKDIKAVRSAVGQHIDDVTSKYSSAASNYNSINESIATLDEQLKHIYEYKNQYDKIWDLSQKITALEWQRNRLAKQYTTMLNEQIFGHEELFSLIKDQQKTYASTITDQSGIIADASRQINDLWGTSYNEIADLADFYEMDWKNLTIRAKVDKQTGQPLANTQLKSGTYSMTDDQISKMESDVSTISQLFDTIRGAYDSIDDARSGLRELMETGKQETQALEDRILDAIKKIRQTTIDNLTTLNDTINKTLSNLVSEVQDRLNDIRQQNENAKTEQSLLDKQQRLAMLQMDTGNGNAVEIAALQKEIAEDQENYFQNLQDQSLQNIQDQNEKASKQREKQIDLLTKQLEYQEKTGQLAAETNAMMQMVSTSDGQDAIESLLISAEGVLTDSFYGNQQWIQDFITQLNQSQAYKDIQDTKIEDVDTSLLTSEILKKFVSQELTVKDETVATMIKEFANNVGGMKDLISYLGGFGEGITPQNIGDNTDTETNTLLDRLKNGDYTTNDKAIVQAMYKKYGTELLDYLDYLGIDSKTIKTTTGASAKEMMSATRDTGEFVFSTSELKNAGLTSAQVTTGRDSGGGHRSIGEIGTVYGNDAIAGSSFTTSDNTTAVVLSNTAETAKIIDAGAGKMYFYSQETGKLDDKASKGKLLEKETIDAVANPVKYGTNMGTALKKGQTSVFNEYMAGLKAAFQKPRKGIDVGKLLAAAAKASGKSVDNIASRFGSFQIKDAPMGKDGSTKGKVNGRLLGDGTIVYNDTKGYNGIHVFNPNKWKIQKNIKIDKNFEKSLKGIKTAWRRYAVYQEYLNWLGTKKNTYVSKAYQKELAKLKQNGFATGGLNTYTGPTWLDGTPSKPELVLNARDTQNFLQLKDILSDVMSGSNTINNNNNPYTENYEININVDKMSSDIDIEEVAQRVKREISMAGSYKTITRGSFR